MKTLKFFPLFLLVLLGLSCSKNENDLPYETVKIQILPTVEINQDDYTPLRSATVESPLVYAVQIYEGEAPIYYGLFNDISKMEINLTTNKKYKVKVAAYQDGSGSGLKTLLQNGVTKYYLPDTVSLLNRFVLGNRLIGISDVTNAKLKSNIYSLYPEIDVLYQEIDATVTIGMSSIDIPLRRTGFGLGIRVDGLSTGNIEVYFAGDTIHLTPTVKSYFSIRSFIGGTKGLADVAKVDTYFVNTDISVKWTGNNGSVVASSKVIKLRRNYQLPLYINLNSTNIGITIENWQNDIKDSIGCDLTVADIDGNVYKTVTIGTQVWMAENLKTTKYKDGTSIPNVTDGTDWAALTTPGYCFYNNDAANITTYGALYNWYAVSDSRNIVPTGWHVATYVDWTTLENYLIANGYNYDNTPGFTLLPRGYRSTNGTFEGVGNFGYWWTLDMGYTTGHMYVYLYHNVNGLQKNYSMERLGGSVRCVRD